MTDKKRTSQIIMGFQTSTGLVRDPRTGEFKSVNYGRMVDGKSRQAAPSRSVEKNEPAPIKEAKHEPKLPRPAEGKADPRAFAKELLTSDKIILDYLAK